MLANLLRPVVVPLYQALGADPAMFAGTLLANDMGGAPLAQELALTQEAGQFGGLIVGAMLGPTIVFTIPVGLGIIKAEDRPYLATGVLAGVITIPIGSFAGGLAAGFPVGMVLRNLIPIALFAVLIALGLAFLPNGMVKGFQVFGRIIVIIITIGLAAAIIQKLTPLTLIPGMNPISEGVAIVGDIAVVLAGVYLLPFGCLAIGMSLGKRHGLCPLFPVACALCLLIVVGKRTPALCLVPALSALLGNAAGAYPRERGGKG